MFRNQSIRQRLIRSGIFAIGAIALIGCIALYSLWKGSGDLDRQIAATDSIRHQMLADTIHDGLVVQVTLAVNAGPYSSIEVKDGMRAVFAEDAEGLRHSVNALLELDLPDAVRDRVQQTIPFVDNFLASAQETIEIAFTADAAGRAAIPAIVERFELLEVELSAMGDLIQSHSYETAVTAQNHILMLIVLVLGVTAVTILGIAYGQWRMMRSITKPLERLGNALLDVAKGDFGIKIANRMRNDDIGAIAKNVDKISERVVVALREQDDRREENETVIMALGTGLSAMAEGDLAQHIDDAFASEYEPLRQSYNKTIDQLNYLMAQVVKLSKAIQSRTSQISTASNDLSQRTETQAATLEETAAALERLTQSVGAAAKNATSVEGVVNSARGDVEKSGTIVEGAIDAMREIEASSTQISQIIGVIDDIAFQTNLLALNAGVEAARAGDSGRGFAVVASEVRALAQRSADAANEIKGLISASSKHVEEGVRRVDGAGKSLGQIVTQVSEISALISDLAKESLEQSHGLEEVNIGVGQLDQVTQRNAAMVEESGVAIAHLDGDTADLNQLIDRFSLMDGRGEGPSQGEAGPALAMSA